MTDRSFDIKGDVAIPAVGSTATYTVDTGGANSVDWLIPGMVISVGKTVATSGNLTPAHVIIRVEGSISINSGDTSFLGKTISGSDGVSIDDDPCTVIGTSFAEGSGAPDVFSEELDNDFGFTQIFKTACEMSNTARATRYRGYADEFQRIWNLKLREHKIDIERAMLFGQRATTGGIQYSEGIAGHVIANSTPPIVTGKQKA